MLSLIVSWFTACFLLVGGASAVAEGLIVMGAVIRRQREDDVKTPERIWLMAILVMLFGAAMFAAGIVVALTHVPQGEQYLPASMRSAS